MKSPIAIEHSSAGGLSLRVSVIDKCELRCLYCMPAEGIRKCSHDDILRFEQIVDFVRLAKGEFGLSKVHLTGGEPLVRKNITSLVSMLSELGVPDIALTTNAWKLAAMARDLKDAGLDRVNISLDSLDPVIFATLTRGGRLRRVLRGLDAAIENRLGPIKFNAVVLRGYNHRRLAQMTRWAASRRCVFRFLELMPIGHAKGMFDGLFVPASEIRQRLSAEFELVPRAYDPGASTRYFEVFDRGGAAGPLGSVGIISGQSEPFCSGCRRLRLTSTGKLISCLARGEGPSVRELLRSGGPADMRKLRDIIAAELASKSARSDFTTPRAMVSVGG